MYDNHFCQPGKCLSNSKKKLANDEKKFRGYTEFALTN